MCDLGAALPVAPGWAGNRILLLMTGIDKCVVDYCDGAPFMNAVGTPIAATRYNSDRLEITEDLEERCAT